MARRSSRSSWPKRAKCPRSNRSRIRRSSGSFSSGFTDEEYESLDQEIDTMLESKVRLKKQMRELRDAGVTESAAAITGEGSAELAGGEDPTGQRAGRWLAI